MLICHRARRRREKSLERAALTRPSTNARVRLAGFYMIAAIALQLFTGWMRVRALEAKGSNFSLLHRVIAASVSVVSGRLYSSSRVAKKDPHGFLETFSHVRHSSRRVGIYIGKSHRSAFLSEL